MVVITEEHVRYLDELRESGVTNMFGAGPYVAQEFGLSEEDGRKIVMSWAKTFNLTDPPAIRAERAQTWLAEGGAP